MAYFIIKYGGKFMKCSNCGEEISDGIKFCPNCGENLEKMRGTDSGENLENPKCPDCGHEIGDAVTFCPNCGCNLKASGEGANPDVQEAGDSQNEEVETIVLASPASEGNSSQEENSKFSSSQNTGVKNQKKSLSDIPEDFKNASTGKQILAVLLCCCIGLTIFGAIGGLIFPDLNTDDSYDDSYDYGDDIISSDSSLSDDGIGDSDIQIRVTCDGDWQGSVGVGSSQASYSGSGDKLINLDGDSSDIVAAAVQKQDSGNGKLKVEIIKEGKVVKDASTTSEYGVVSLAD